MTEWQPIDTAPYMQIIEVKNDSMSEPVKATRGYVIHNMVHPDQTFCTSVFTQSENQGPTYAGQLICPNVWRQTND